MGGEGFCGVWIGVWRVVTCRQREAHGGSRLCFQWEAQHTSKPQKHFFRMNSSTEWSCWGFYGYLILFVSLKNHPCPHELCLFLESLLQRIKKLALARLCLVPSNVWSNLEFGHSCELIILLSFRKLVEWMCNFQLDPTSMILSSISGKWKNVFIIVYTCLSRLASRATRISLNNKW